MVIASCSDPDFNPSIENFSPNSGDEGTIVTISGKNFNTTLLSTNVYINDKIAQTKSVTGNQIVFSVPGGLQEGSFPIVVVNRGITLSSKEKFNIVPQVKLTSFSPEKEGEGAEVILYGRNFSEILSENIIKFNNVLAEPISLGPDGTYLITKVPAEATTGKISIRVGDVEFTHEKNFIVSPWSREAPLAGAGRCGASSFSINGKIYVFNGYTQYGYNGYLGDYWRYNPANDTWSKLGKSPIDRGIAISVNGAGYLISVGCAQCPAYKYIAENNSWIKLKEFPNKVIRNHPVGFSIGNTIYVGLGLAKFTTGIVNYNDFWAYNTVTDTWTEKATFPGTTSLPGSENWHSTGIELNGEGYLIVEDQLWKYAPNSNTWEFQRKVDFTSGAFSINDKGYFFSGGYQREGEARGFYKYDPISKIWRELDWFPGPAKSGAIVVVIDEVAYIGLGGHFPNRPPPGTPYNESLLFRVLDDFWKYNPQKEKL